MIRGAVVLALAVAAASPAPAQEPLRPLTLRQDLLGWEGVGRIALGRDGYCTGVLVAGDLVLTAAHCLFDGGVPRPREDITFRAGDRNGEAVAERRAVQAVVPEGYHPDHRDAAARIARDVALLRLETAIPSGTARPFRVEAAPPGGEVSVVSYGAGRDGVLSRQAGCNILGRQIEVIAIDCDVTFGSSGAPVFRLDGTTTRIVSIVSAGETGAEEDLAFGPVLDRRMDELTAALRAGGGLWEVDAPSPRRLTATSERSAGGARFLRP